MTRIPELFTFMTFMTSVIFSHSDQITMRAAAKKQLEKLRLEKHTAETVNVENYNHIDFSSMDRRQKQYSTANFRGADRLLSAIRNNDEKFEVIDNSIDDWDPFNEKKFAIFETTSKFHLKKNVYLVLDDISNDVSLHVRALSESNIVHCGSRHLTDVIWQPGSVVLGSVNGEWSKLPHVRRALENMNLPPKDGTSSTTARRIGDGFLILRRITSITSATESELQSGCVKLHTEDIHPFELFHSFNFESLTQLPYNHVYGGEENEEEEDNRELNSNYAFPDNPMKYCSDPSFGPFDPPNWWTFPKYAVKYGNPYTTNQDFLALMSLKNGGCIQYSKDFSGGFYYNYDPILKKAIQKQIPIINGVTCDECYASLGGGFLLLLDYTPSLKIKVEAKNVGPVRFNANIKVKDPSISGSFSKELVAPATKWVDIPLGYGFFLNYKFGGLSALVTGSGSLKGSAQFGAATSAKIKMAALNVDGKTSYPFSFTPGPVTPYDNSDGFTSAKLNLAIALTTIQNFRLSLGIQLLEISANFDASIGGSLTLKAGLVFNAKHVAFVNVIPPSTTERKLLNLDSSNYFVVPGDHVKILFTYEGYPTNEAITLFYSLVKPNGESISIMTKDFKTSIGSGVLEATWVVPWDTVFADMTTLQTSKLAARASTDITEIFYSPPYITLKLFTETDGIFDTPTIGEVVPSDTPYLVTWNASRLIHFQTNGWNRPDGQLIEINNILFELCGEVLKRNTNGTMVVDRTWCADIYPINGETTSLNNGSAMLVFPSVFVTYGDRFYVNIRSVDYQSVTSWSKWYFFLTTTTNTNHPSSHDLDSTHNTRSSIILSSSTDNLRKEPTKNTNLDISNSPPKNLPYPSTVILPSSTPVTSLLVTNYSNKNPDDRKLAVVSCTLTTPVPVYSTTFNALCGTAFTGITFSLVKFKFTIPLGDPPKPNPIGPPIVRCYDGKKNPTPPPFPFTVINNKKPTSKPSRRKPTRKPSKKPNKRPTSF